MNLKIRKRKLKKIMNSPVLTSQSPSKNFGVNGAKVSSPEDEKLSSSPTKRRKFSSSQPSTRSPGKNFTIDANLLYRAIENLNLAKRSVLPLEFDLESIYSAKSFDLCQLDSKIDDDSPKYDHKDVNLAVDNNGHLMSKVLIDILSDPMNCGYFDSDELDVIFSILTLSTQAQSLLARMLKRKRGWHRVDCVKYPDIADDLGPVFRELVEREIFNDDTSKENLSTLLNLLSVEEIRNACKAMRVNHKGAKACLVGELVKLSSRKKSLFPGMKSPSCALVEKITLILGACVRLVENREKLFERIFILLIPNQDPRENMVDAFRTLADVKYGDKIFPPTPLQRFPIFANRSHLVDYAEARNVLTRIYGASDSKNWEAMCAMGRLALERLESVLRKNGDENDDNDENDDDDDKAKKSSKLPSYVRRFEVNYTWAKVLWKSIEGFKKTRDGIEKAAEILHSLVVNRRKAYFGNTARWYSELALIEMYHRKNLEISAEITIEALKDNKLSENDIAQLSERARKLLGRSKNISASTKERLVEATARLMGVERSIAITKPRENIIEATMVQGNTSGTKSTWSVGIGGTDVGYLRVEEIALLHYSGKGFSGGLHCEGSLPVTLFATLLWNEIYGIAVPGAFVSSYQTAPLDLYSTKFIENRRENVENKLSLVRGMNLEELGRIMSEDYGEYRKYVSLINGKLFDDPVDLGTFVECLGTAGIVGICERMANDYNQWKAGFPDLVVWDPIQKRCKFVEVKGPGDSLSTKQKLWIQYLESLDVGVEVCIVKGTTRKYAV